jgi:hypothetical protein
VRGRTSYGNKPDSIFMYSFFAVHDPLIAACH